MTPMSGKAETPMILNTSDEAARFVTNISGWVSRDGLFFGKDERTARWSGCTHVACETCGTPTPKGYLICDACRSKKDAEKYEAREKRKWDGPEMAYSEAVDKYFTDWDEAEDYCEQEEWSMESLRLVICEPNYAREVESDFWCDDLAEDGELPPGLEKALEELNSYIRDEKIILSWSPGKYAVDLSAEG